jgi:hypothetical protein
LRGQVVTGDHPVGLAVDIALENRMALSAITWLMRILVMSASGLDLQGQDLALR